MQALHALADPTRRAILELVARQGPTASSVIGSHFAVTASAISQHLKVLTQAGLLARETRGQQRIYRLELNGFDDVEKWLARTRWFAEQSHIPA